MGLKKYSNVNCTLNRVQKIYDVSRFARYPVCLYLLKLLHNTHRQRLFMLGNTYVNKHEINAYLYYLETKYSIVFS